MHGCLGVFTGTCVPVCVETREPPWVSFFRHHLDKVAQWLELTKWARLGGHGAQGLACFCLSSAEIISAKYKPLSFRWHKSSALLDNIHTTASCVYEIPVILSGYDLAIFIFVISVKVII